MRAEPPSLRPIELQRLRVPGTTDKYTQTTTHTNTDRQTDAVNSIAAVKKNQQEDARPRWPKRYAGLRPRIIHACTANSHSYVYLLTTDVSCHGKGMYLSAARVRFPWWMHRVSICTAYEMQIITWSRGDAIRNRSGVRGYTVRCRRDMLYFC